MPAAALALKKPEPVEDFEWPESFDDFAMTIPTVEFLAWLWDVGEIDFPNERLWPLYQEWSCIAGSKPIKLWELKRQLTVHGVERYRLPPRWVNGEQRRPTRYRLKQRHA